MKIHNIVRITKIWWRDTKWQMLKNSNSRLAWLGVAMNIQFVKKQTKNPHSIYEAQ